MAERDKDLNDTNTSVGEAGLETPIDSRHQNGMIFSDLSPLSNEREIFSNHIAGYVFYIPLSVCDGLFPFSLYILCCD